MDFPFKAKSYTANKKYLYGYSIDITRPFLDNRTALATCLEYICSDVMNNGSFNQQHLYCNQANWLPILEIRT